MPVWALSEILLGKRAAIRKIIRFNITRICSMPVILKKLN